VEACIGAAHGLRYLHESQIIHGDVKTANILLDEEWLTKITDPGLSNTGSSSDREVLPKIRGTIGYLDPETDQLTEKSDVFSFGVVLLEVLCARPSISRGGPGIEVNLIPWALRCKKHGNLDLIVDPYLKGKINPQCLDKFVNIAEKCLAYRGIDRPSMGDVILDLEYALQLQGGAVVSA
jgi:serine/threonine protein kinase